MKAVIAVVKIAYSSARNAYASAIAAPSKSAIGITASPSSSARAVAISSPTIVPAARIAILRIVSPCSGRSTKRIVSGTQ